MTQKKSALKKKTRTRQLFDAQVIFDCTQDMKNRIVAHCEQEEITIAEFCRRAAKLGLEICDKTAIQ